MKTNTTTTHIDAVQQMYAAFGRGAIPTILSYLHEDVEWRVNVDLMAPGATSVPTFRPCRGPGEVAAFFQSLSAAVEIHRFEPVSFMTNEHEVSARLFIEYTVRPTGKRGRSETIHHWTFDESGKVTRFLDFLDTLATANDWNLIQPKT